MKPRAILLGVMALAVAPVAAKTFPREMPGPAWGSAPGDTAAVEAAHRGNRNQALASPRTEPAFGDLFVLVLPWNSDRYLIEARRKLQFALRLDEPKQPVFRVTLRF